MKFVLKRLPRGENSGKGFFISTFRFDLPLAQALEKIALASGLSMSSVINQVLQQFVDGVDVPDNIKPVKTAQATVWGEEKEKPAKATKKVKKAKVAVEEEEEEDEEPAPKKKKVKKVAKVEKVVKKKAKIAVEEDDDEEDEPAPKKKKAAAGVLGKLKKKAKISVDDEVPDDD